jgi:branched-chain amino acid transport system permease protein
VGDQWLQVITNGVSNGAILALLTCAFAVVYTATNTFHLSLCAIFIAAPSLALGALRAGLGWPLSVVIALALGIGLSWCAGTLNHERLEKRNASGAAHLISGLGLYLMISQTVVLLGGSESKMLKSSLDPSHSIGSVAVTNAQIISVICSTVILTVFLGLVRLSRMGLRLRALSANAVECQLRGIDVGQIRATAYGVAGLLGAASGLLAARGSGFDPNGGFQAGLVAIAALIIGGRSSLLGPIVGAVMLGMIRSAAVWELSAGWQEPVTFLVLAAFLLLRPKGLLQFGRGWESGS